LFIIIIVILFAKQYIGRSTDKVQTCIIWQWQTAMQRTVLTAAFNEQLNTDNRIVLNRQYPSQTDGNIISIIG